MQEINVLVTFCSRTGATERIALAAALGAVQAKAKIRLRWLREDMDQQIVDADREWKENRARMAREYIGPREIDVLWADAMVLAIPPRTAPSAAHLKAHLDCLGSLQSAGKLDGKLLTLLAGASGLAAMYPVLAGLNLTLVPPCAAETAVDSSRLHGRKLTALARALKQS